MKTTLARQGFQDALHAVAALAGGRTTRPILSCTKISVQQGQVELSATDGEAGLRLEVSALSTAEDGEIVVPVDRLLGIVREMGDAEISLESDERYCTIRGEGCEFHIFVMNVDDFPPVAEFEGESDFVMATADLRRLVNLTLYAAARETSRYAINGVLLQKAGNRLSIVATDGRRLARAGCPVNESKSADFEVILPAKAMSVFERVFTPTNDPDGSSVEVVVMPNQVVLRGGGRVLSTVLVEGSFPKYDDVIPKEHNKRARISREALLAAVTRTALLTTEESRAVKLAFEGEQLVITSQAPEQGDARVEVPISYEGEALTIGFNPVFLRDALRILPFDEVVLDLHETFRPGVLSGGEKDEFLYVVMPVSLTT